MLPDLGYAIINNGCVILDLGLSIIDILFNNKHAEETAPNCQSSRKQVQEYQQAGQTVIASLTEV